MDEGGVVRPHTIDAMMRLAGRQDTAVTVNHAGTPEATVVVQLGRAVVYLHSMETADRFANIWQGAQRDAEQLPRGRNLDRGPRTGPLAIAEPSIVVPCGRHTRGDGAGWSRPTAGRGLPRYPGRQPGLAVVRPGGVQHVGGGLSASPTGCSRASEASRSV